MFKLSAERAAADSYVDDALDTTRSATVTSTFTDAAVDVSTASMFATFAFRQHSDVNVITTRN